MLEFPESDVPHLNVDHATKHVEVVEGWEKMNDLIGCDSNGEPFSFTVAPSIAISTARPHVAFSRLVSCWPTSYD